MKIPTKEQIEDAAEQAGTNRFSKINGNTHRDLANEEHYFVEGFADGASYMEQQLEPIITELRMENARHSVWVSLEQEYPPCNLPVLVSLRGGFSNRRMCKVDEYIDKEWRYTGDGFITHWMRLPLNPNQ